MIRRGRASNQGSKLQESQGTYQRRAEAGSRLCSLKLVDVAFLLSTMRSKRLGLGSSNGNYGRDCFEDYSIICTQKGRQRFASMLLLELGKFANHVANARYTHSIDLYQITKYKLLASLHQMELNYLKCIRKNIFDCFHVRFVAFIGFQSAVGVIF